MQEQDNSPVQTKYAATVYICVNSHAICFEAKTMLVSPQVLPTTELTSMKKLMFNNPHGRIQTHEFRG